MSALPREIMGLDDIRHFKTQFHGACHRHAIATTLPLRCWQMIPRYKVKFRGAPFQHDERRAFMPYGQANGVGVEGAGQQQITGEDLKEEPHVPLLAATGICSSVAKPPW